MIMSNNRVTKISLCYLGQNSNIYQHCLTSDISVLFSTLQHLLPGHIFIVSPCVFIALPSLQDSQETSSHGFLRLQHYTSLFFEIKLVLQWCSPLIFSLFKDHSILLLLIQYLKTTDLIFFPHIFYCFCMKASPVMVSNYRWQQKIPGQFLNNVPSPGRVSIWALESVSLFINQSKSPLKIKSFDQLNELPLLLNATFITWLWDLHFIEDE